LTYLWVAISLGFIGSAHCAGMCGPILLTVNQGETKWTQEIAHHAGRLLTYMLFGSVAGALGTAISLMGAQQTFSIAIGIIMIAGVLLLSLTRYIHQFETRLGRFAIKFTGWSHSLPVNKTTLRFLLGIGNGILPCAMVYIAVAGASATFTPWDGALFMLFFGLGTLPALISITAFAKSLSSQWRSKIRRLVPITVLVMGVVLILRGSNLGVPYLSPAVSESGSIEQCD